VLPGVANIRNADLAVVEKRLASDASDLSLLSDKAITSLIAEHCAFIKAARAAPAAKS
jgi:hypothetical protein